MVEEKACSKCKVVKVVKDFYRNKRKKEGLTSWCKSCYGEYQQSPKGRDVHRRADKKYRNSSQGKEVIRRKNLSLKTKKSKKRYQQSPRGKEVYRYANKKYEATPKGKVNKKRYLQSIKGRQYQKKNKAIRRTNQTNAGGSYSSAQWYKLCKFYNFYCLRCGKQLPFKDLTLDHIKPVSKGGTSNIWNVQPLCSKCNKKKGTQETDYRQTVPDWINRDGPTWIQDKLF